MNNAQQLYDKFTKSTDPKIIIETAHEINKHFKWTWGQEPIDEIGEEFLYVIDAKQESFEWLILMMIHQLNGVGYHEYFTVLENRENSISDVQCKWGKIVLKEIQNQMTEPFKGYTSELIKVFERVIERSTQQEKDTDLRDDKLYKTINIGNQIWMVENLNVDKFRNGDPIPHCKTIEEWTEAGYEGKPAWCYYENNTEKGNIYGKLYNWYAVNDPRRLEPASWHVPTDEEWKVLEMVLGMSRAEVDGFGPRGTNEGSKLAGNEALWADGNLKSNKVFGSSGFVALPGGHCQGGTCTSIGNHGIWWTSSQHEINPMSAWYRSVFSSKGNIMRNADLKHLAYSVRCIRDSNNKILEQNKKLKVHKSKNVISSLFGIKK